MGSFAPLSLSYVSRKTNSTFFGEISENFLWGVAGTICKASVLPSVSILYYMYEIPNTTILGVALVFSTEKRRENFVGPFSPAARTTRPEPPRPMPGGCPLCGPNATQRLRCAVNPG